MSTVVILCDHAHPSGGLAKVAIASAVGLAGRGHRVHFFTAVPPIDPALLTDGITVHCLEQADLKGNADRVQAALRDSGTAKRRVPWRACLPAARPTTR